MAPAKERSAYKVKVSDMLKRKKKIKRKDTSRFVSIMDKTLFESQHPRSDGAISVNNCLPLAVPKIFHMFGYKGMAKDIVQHTKTSTTSVKSNSFKPKPEPRRNTYTQQCGVHLEKHYKTWLFKQKFSPVIEVKLKRLEDSHNMKSFLSMNGCTTTNEKQSRCRRSHCHHRRRHLHRQSRPEDPDRNSKGSYTSSSSYEAPDGDHNYISEAKTRKAVELGWKLASRTIATIIPGVRSVLGFGFGMPVKRPVDNMLQEQGNGCEREAGGAVVFAPSLTSTVIETQESSNVAGLEISDQSVVDELECISGELIPFETEEDATEIYPAPTAPGQTNEDNQNQNDNDDTASANDEQHAEDVQTQFENSDEAEIKADNDRSGESKNTSSQENAFMEFAKKMNIPCSSVTKRELWFCDCQEGTTRGQPIIKICTKERTHYIAFATHLPGRFIELDGTRLRKCTCSATERWNAVTATIEMTRKQVMYEIKLRRQRRQQTLATLQPLETLVARVGPAPITNLWRPFDDSDPPDINDADSPMQTDLGVVDLTSEDIMAMTDPSSSSQ